MSDNKAGKRFLRRSPVFLTTMTTLLLLKNVLLSAYSLIHVQSIYSCTKGLSTWAEMVGIPPKESATDDDDESSVRQKHMLGCLKGFNIAMLYLCVSVGLSSSSSSSTEESSSGQHALDQILLAEAALYAITGYDAIKLGITKYLVAYLIPAVVSGMVVFLDRV